jgi:glycosyltransferase involved in cell wall biosynthesis
MDVTVIIPTYNRAAELALALQSALMQDPPPAEIIVADDGSSDATRDVARGVGPRVTYLRLAHSGRPAVARNAALRQARGELIAFLDDDDRFLPHKLALQTAALAAHPDAACVYSDGLFFRDDPSRPCGQVLAGMPAPSGDVFAPLLRGNFLFPALLLLRRACLDEVGGFDEARVTAEDYDLWLRLAVRHPFVHAPGQVAAIRRHPGSLSADAARVRCESLAVLRRLDATAPARMRAAAAARSEGYARHHGAVALALARRRQLLGAAAHAAASLAHALRHPRTGAAAFTRWRRRKVLSNER